MSIVERVKQLCKERKIAIYRLEKDCGFANGYLSGLKKGTIPPDRLQKIADYLGVSYRFLLDGEEADPDVVDMFAGSGPTIAYISKRQMDLLDLFERLNEEGKRNAIVYLRYLLTEDEFVDQEEKGLSSGSRIG